MTLDIFLSMLFNLVGGLGIFLLGMQYMQQGLQVVAGPRVRRLINSVTSNRFVAVGIGTLVTMLVQSSSITSVMVIGLVNSGLMTLAGAMGMIMGANIGTTVTGWILVLKIGKYGLPMIGFSAFVWLFVKKEGVRYTALAILGIGLIFFGLELMKNGFAPLRDMPEFKTWFHAFEATSYIGVLKAALVGCILTMIVQSSSATLGITIALATTGVIDFPTAGALVLGENIGTTITALLASLGVQDINAKRTAYWHFIFNVLGVMWITAVYLPIYMPFVRDFIIGHDPGMLVDGDYPYMTSAIASVHTGFNVVNTLIFIPFLNFFSSLLISWVKPGKGSESRYQTSLDFKPGASPLSAIERSRYEIEKLDSVCADMMTQLKTVISATDMSKKDRKAAIKSLIAQERRIDKIQIEITSFLTELLAESISQQLAEEARSQLRMADEYESVSDYVVNILKVYLRIEEHEEHFSKEQKKELLDLHDRITVYFKHVHDGLEEPDEDYLAHIRSTSKEITNTIRLLRKKHWERLSQEKSAPMISTSYMDIATAYRRVKDHLLNIAEAIEGGKKLKIKSKKS